MLLHTSFGEEYRKIRRKRNVLVEIDPIFGKERDSKEFELPAEEASKLDRLLQAAFMSFSLPFPSSSPSAYPTIYPSSAPSSIPTIPYVCPIDIVEGRTFYFVAAKMCVRMQLFAGGKLEGDSTDNSCANPVFNPTQELSIFAGIDIVTNKAIFSPGAGGFSGTVEIKETPSITGTEFNLLDLTGQIFSGQVVISSCASEPSLVPSLTPSLAPSLAPIPSVPCSISDFVGETFFFSGVGSGVNLCFRVVIGAGGELVGNPNDPTCANIPGFVSQVQFSIFDSIDTINNLAIYTPGTQGFSGTITIRESPSAIQTELLLLGPPANQSFAAALIIPSCSI